MRYKIQKKNIEVFLRSNAKRERKSIENVEKEEERGKNERERRLEQSLEKGLRKADALDFYATTQ